MRSIRILYLAAIVFALGCKSKNQQTVITDSLYNTRLAYQIKPKGPPPAWAPDMKPQMQAVIERLQLYGDQPIETLGPGRARKNHSALRAAEDVLKDNHIAPPVDDMDTLGKDIPAGWGNVHLRFYTIKKAAASNPVIVYLHGGGFVTSGIAGYDASARALATKTGAIVVSVGYRLAPQYLFPYAHNDAFKAYLWVLKNAALFKGDSTKVAVAGEDSGGNLAVNIGLKAKAAGVKPPVAILAIYPFAGTDMKTASYTQYADGLPLSRGMMTWYFKKYLSKSAELHDPQIDLVSANLKGLPPTIVITAEIDPLQSEGLKLADKLRADGVTVYSRNYVGVTHDFFGMDAVVPDAYDAQLYAAGLLKKLWAGK